MLGLANLSNWGQNLLNQEANRRREEEQRRLENQPLRIQIPPNYTNQNVANFYLEGDIECMAQYRDESGKLVMPEEFRDISDKDVYFYLGHGSTILDPFGNPVIKTVPDDCIYITQTTCGIVNRFDHKLIRQFLNPANDYIWKDPITNINQLRSLFRNAPGIHIHMPGCSYTESSFLPFSSNGKKTDRMHFLQYSGLISLRNANTIPPDDYLVKGYHETIDEGKIDASIVKELYKYSSFPLAHERSIRTRIPQSALDGIYLFKDAEQKVPIEDLVNQTATLSDNYHVSRIMEMKPGIHFNFLCRSISSTNKSKRAITLRRKHSALLQNTLANTISKLAAMGFRSNSAAKELSNEKSILSFMKSVREEIKERKDLENTYKAYMDLKFYNYEDAKKYLGDLFEDMYKDKFMDLTEKLAEAEDEETIRKLKEEREKLVKILDMKIPHLDNPRMFEMEIELMVSMALAALTLEDFEFYTFLCKRGVDMARLYKLLKNDVRNGSITKEFLDSIELRLDDCHRERIEYVYPNTNNEHTSSNNNSNSNNEVGSYNSGSTSNTNRNSPRSGRGGKRKTLRRKK